jgi:two-component system response regulator ArlR
MKILIVEDSKQLCQGIEAGFIQEGFKVETALDGKLGYQKAMVNSYDTIILDLNLPYKDGLEIASQVRQEDTDTPIIALTARDKLTDKIKGFDTGFDDYLTKPFDIKELIARVRALIRRAKPNSHTILKSKGIKMDPKKRKVWLDEKEIKLTKTEFNILELLMRNQNIPVEKNEIIEKVWGDNPDIIQPPVRAHIKKIRKKLNDENFELIKTIPGVGYKID